MPPPPFELLFSDEAERVLRELDNDRKKRDRVRKALGLLQSNPRHHSLKTHKYDELVGPNGEEVFEAYVENRTPAAYRVFWYHVKGQRGVIGIITITPHP